MAFVAPAGLPRLAATSSTASATSFTPSTSCRRPQPATPFRRAARTRAPAMSSAASPLAPQPWSDGAEHDGGAAAWLASAAREARAGNVLAARHMYGCASAAAAVEAGERDGGLSGRDWLAWAKVEARLAGWSEAVGVLERAVEAVPGDPYLWVFWGREALKRGDRAEARRVLKEGAGICRGSSVLRCELARLEAGAGNVETARKLYREAVVADGTDSHAYMQWAGLEGRAGRVHAARAVFAQGVKAVSKGDAAVLYTAFAQLEANAGHGKQARFLFMRAAEANPSDRYIWQAWASFEAGAGKVERARELFERAVLVNGGRQPTIWQAWGLLEEKAGDLDTARHLFSRGTIVDPTDAATWAAWGRLEAAAGSPVEARRLFEHAAGQVAPRTPAGALFLTWAMFEAEQGDAAGAAAILQRAIDRGNDSRDDTVRLVHALGMLELRAGRPAAARPLFQRALRLKPSDVMTAHALARVEIAAGAHARARAILLRAKLSAPTDGHITATLATLEWQHFADGGGVARARSLFSSGARATPNDATLIRAWAAFETAQGNRALGDRLRKVASQRPQRS